MIRPKQFWAHQLIWFMQTGEWPDQIDHKNGNAADNRWENLRIATSRQNSWNRSRKRALPRGVTKTRYGDRYWANATIRKEDGTKGLKYLGTFDTPEEAHAAWLAYVSKMRGEFLRSD